MCVTPVKTTFDGSGVPARSFYRPPPVEQNSAEFYISAGGRALGIHSDREVTDEGLRHIAEMTQLTTLSFQSTPVTDAGLEHLQELTRLHWLSLQHTQVTDVGLKCLAGLSQLESLWLNGTQVTDAGLEHLAGLTQLRDVYLPNTQVSDSGVKKLQQALPNCSISR